MVKSSAKLEKMMTDEALFLIFFVKADFDNKLFCIIRQNAARDTLSNLVCNVCRYEQIVRLGMNLDFV